MGRLASRNIYSEYSQQLISHFKRRSNADWTALLPTMIEQNLQIVNVHLVLVNAHNLS